MNKIFSKTGVHRSANTHNPALLTNTLMFYAFCSWKASRTRGKYLVSNKPLLIIYKPIILNY